MNHVISPMSEADAAGMLPNTNGTAPAEGSLQHRFTDTARQQEAENRERAYYLRVVWPEICGGEEES